MTYYNYSDCRMEGVDAALPANEWRWSIGNIWIATVGETNESWWGTDTPEDLGVSRPDVMTYPIDQVPTTGTLLYWDAEGNEIEVTR